MVAAAVSVTACSRESPEAAPTSTLPLITTTVVPSTTTSSTTTTTLPPIRIGSFPEYRIVFRGEAAGPGDSVVVLLDPTSYDQLSDLDLYNVVVDVVEEFPPIYEAYVIDDEIAYEAVLAETPTAEQRRLLDMHYLARLEEGFRVVYLGPYADSGSSVLGS